MMVTVAVALCKTKREIPSLSLAILIGLEMAK